MFIIVFGIEAVTFWLKNCSRSNNFFLCTRQNTRARISQACKWLWKITYHFLGQFFIMCLGGVFHLTNLKSFILSRFDSVFSCICTKETKTKLFIFFSCVLGKIDENGTVERTCALSIGYFFENQIFHIKWLYRGSKFFWVVLI